MAAVAVLANLLSVVQIVGMAACASQRRATGRLATVRRPPERPPAQTDARGTQTLPRSTSAPVASVDPTRAAAGGLVERATVALSEGRVADAADLLERAVAVDPSFPGTYMHLARLHLEQGEQQLALAFLDKAELLAAEDAESAAEIATLRGVVLEQLGRRDAARRAYERALSLTPHDERARAGLVRTGGQRW